ncbi:hypothetical protein NP493_965g01036 [Ridgeia piscesae]|uniref:RING-type domain-containing protein n=1 Tax=Ridgeia piscesae TaxID=27915 RepID=A0AAD9KKN4_RIDPI|nr:hypothetical protein NP493_965g01036 [Ridgeia piscesae]
MVCVLDVSMATTMLDDQIHLRVQDLNPVLTCELCGGYYVGATTITTCLHTFCRSCIARHTDFSLHCPKCDLLIHPTDPFVNMRPDCTIQDIVYKLLPHLEKDEKRRERKFYTSRGIPYPLQPTATPRRKQMKEGTRWVSQAPCVHLISVKLIYLGTKPGLGSYPPLVNKYLRIPDYTTIGHIERFVQQMLHVHATRQVCVFIGTCLLHETLTLVRSVELSRRGGDQEKIDEDEDALVKLHYGIVPRKNYFEYFARDGEAGSRVNSDKVNNSSNSGVTVSGVTATVDTVTVDDSDDCIIIS